MGVLRRRRMLMALGLVLLAPTVGEFLLGNIAISHYASVLFLAPLYGGGALLVREAARRLGGGWPTIVVLAAAYALIEEGPVDQMIFNPRYLGLGSFAGYGEIPGLGISLTLVLWSLALHTVWSIAVPIALVESFDPAPTLPWLGHVGFLVTVGVFVSGCVALGWVQADQFRFVGTPAQFGATALLIVALIVIGCRVGRRPVQPSRSAAPAPVCAGLAAFALTSGYWLAGDLPVSEQATAAAQLLAFVVAGGLAVVLVRRWSRRSGWDGRHRLALAAGAVATYALWFGPSQAHEAGTSTQLTVLGAAVFGSGVFMVALAGAVRQRHLVAGGASSPVDRSGPR